MIAKMTAQKEKEQQKINAQDRIIFNEIAKRRCCEEEEANELKQLEKKLANPPPSEAEKRMNARKRIIDAENVARRRCKDEAMLHFDDFIAAFRELKYKPNKKKTKAIITDTLHFEMAERERANKNLPRESRAPLIGCKNYDARLSSSQVSSY